MTETNLTGTTPDITAQNIEALKSLFPEVCTDGKIDFEKLHQLLGKEVDTSPERYNFSWNGKSQALHLSQSPSTGTLIPCKGESKNFDSTQNLYIEGDNLEVLKLLQKPYHKAVKMIYIDPPYNTGSDFVYPDDYKDSIENYLELTGQVDSDGRKIGTNAESNGRYHTDWLNMMYPRLRLARNLLRDDGVIFISIDDHEQANLKKICDEVFGEDNFVCQFIWNTEGHTDNQFAVKINHEYILSYAKNIHDFVIGNVIDPNTRSESNLWKGFAENSITKNGEANPVSEVVLPVGFPCKLSNGTITNNMQSDNFFSEVKSLKYISRTITEKYKSDYPIRFNDMIINNGHLSNSCTVFSGWANVNKLKEFINNKCEPIREPNGDLYSFYLSEKGVIYYYKERKEASNIISVLRKFGTTESMRSELEKEKIFFSYPKPKELIIYLIKMGCPDKDSIVLDFFSGSATTAHAVMQLNADDIASGKQGTRKFIMVQLPESCKEDSEAFKAGYKTICEIGKERIRRAGDKIQKELEEKLKDVSPDLFKLTTQAEPVLDIGFKVFKLASSNIKKWNPDYEHLDESLWQNVNSFVDGRTELDAVYEIMLKLGLNLTDPVEEKELAGKKVYSIASGIMIICLDKDITTDLAHAVVGLQKTTGVEEMRVVFNDAGFKDDVAKTNCKEILKQGGILEFVTI